MAGYGDALARMDGRLATVFDEASLRFRPRRAGAGPGAGARDVNRRADYDPDRPEQIVAGTFWRQPPADRMPMHLSQDPGITAGGTTVSYDAVAAVPASALSDMPRRGDHVEADGETWRIEAAALHGTGRPVFYLSRAKM